ncbi:MAG: tRNA-i(6)A37 methylthiotransferase [Myxococcaceae bacterium]|nr:tRNA-i(6)A37 methylthiotransferase [Myxococcaceae bacterium]
MKRYSVQTFGCQMNVHDSRRIEEVLEAQGYTPAEGPSDADVIVLNTCSVREKAEQKLRSMVGTYKGLKALRPDLVIVVAGCVAQQEGERLLRRVPHLDVVIGPDNIVELPALIEHVRDGAPPLARTVFDVQAPAWLVAKPRTKQREVTGFVTVMKGCDERCTYCIVPYTRGPERYRPAAEIIDELARLVAGGVREITLLGQTVNSWHSLGAGEGESEFPQLLRRIASEVPELLRLRYTSPHPRHLTDELIAAHAELAVLPRHVHLPVQSGSDRMLKRMLRRYTAADYVKRVQALQARAPGLTVSTDMIVGFPGESDEDFEATLRLVREVGFVSLFGFKYSPRPYTPALKLDDDVPEALKDERLQRLFALSAELQRDHLASCVGKKVKVLVESRDETRPDRYAGRSERHELVHLDVPAGLDPIGTLVEVEVVEAYNHSLRAMMEGGSFTLVPGPVSKRAPTRLPMVSA